MIAITSRPTDSHRMFTKGENIGYLDTTSFNFATDEFSFVCSGEMREHKIVISKEDMLILVGRFQNSLAKSKVVA